MSINGRGGGNSFYSSYNPQHTININNSIGGNQYLPADIQKQQMNKGVSLLPDYSMQVSYSVPPSTSGSVTNSIDTADFHKPIISAHNSNQGQVRTGYQHNTAYPDHAPNIPLHNTVDVSYKHQNAQYPPQPPQPALTYPRHDKNFEPKIQSRSDRHPVPPINMHGLNPSSINNSNGIINSTNSNSSNTNNPAMSNSRNNSLRSSSDSIGSHMNTNKTTSTASSNNNNSRQVMGDNQLRSSKDSIRDSKENIGSASGSGGTSSSKEFATTKPPINSSTAAISSGRQEFVESPRSKQAYKEFYKHFKAKEKDSIPVAKAFAVNALKSVPENAVWRVYLELADLAKRSNLIQEVGFNYEVCILKNGR